MPKLFALVLLGLIVSHQPVMAGAPEIVNAGADGVAIDGFDAVAYFTQARPVKGNSEFAHAYKGALWLFASAAHRDAFAAEPERYAPQYNGFCAVAVSEGAAAEVDFVDGWVVHGGQLYLNWSDAVKETFLSERAERIAAADRLWPEVHADMKHGIRQIARHKDFPEEGIVHPQPLPD